MTVTIVRPSIVGCSYKDPFPGWTESVTAANAVLLFGGLGILKIYLGN